MSDNEKIDLYKAREKLLEKGLIDNESDIKIDKSSYESGKEEAEKLRKNNSTLAIEIIYKILNINQC